MTDVDIEAELAAIRQRQADREAAEAAASAAEAARNAALDEAKAVCLAKCGPISEALSQATDPEERAALITLEERAHAEHAEVLEQAYLTFAGQAPGESNPAGGETEIESHVAVASETAG